MNVYIGIFSNKGKRIENDTQALAFAFKKCGIAPLDGWDNVDKDFGRILLEWYYSGNWICDSQDNGIVNTD